MNEVSNNKQKKGLFIFGLSSLLFMVVTATYAYFSTTTITNFGTSTINAQAGGIGSVTLNGNNVQLSMELTALDMQQQHYKVCQRYYEYLAPGECEDENCSDVLETGYEWCDESEEGVNGCECSNSGDAYDLTYYAGPSGKTTNGAFITLGTATVTPNTDTNYYSCSYTLNVTHTGTNDMYDLFNHKTGNVYDYTNRSTGQIVLTINETNYDFYNAWPSTVNGTLLTRVGKPGVIRARFYFRNKGNVNQSYLAGSDINISISVANNTFSCNQVPTTTKYWSAPTSYGYVYASNAVKSDGYDGFTQSFFIRELQAGGVPAEHELCYNTGSSIICMKSDDYANIATYKSALESAGFTCNYVNSEFMNGLYCYKSNPHLSIRYGTSGWVEASTVNDYYGCYVSTIASESNCHNADDYGA